MRLALWFPWGGYGRIAGALIVWRFFHDSPESKGFPPVNVLKEKKTMSASETTDLNKAQRQVLDNACYLDPCFIKCIYVYQPICGKQLGSFLSEAQKGYSTLDASFIISISSVCGIIGTMFSGVISDKLFGGRRNVPALIFGLTNVLALCLFLLVPGVHFLARCCGNDPLWIWASSTDLFLRWADGC